MAKVTLSKKRVLHLLGKQLDDATLTNRSNMMGAAVDDLEGDSLVLDGTANRPDLLSEEGYVRALKKFLDVEPGISKYEVKKSDYSALIDPSTKSVREFAVCAVVKNVPMNDELFNGIIQLQEKLHGTIARRRKNAAIGVHDLSKIAFPITYTTVDETFSFVPLDATEKMTVPQILEKHQKGKEYKHLTPGPKYPMWIDARNEVIAFPPIINGNKTAIDATTKDLFIDVTGPHKKTVEQVLALVVTTLAEAGADVYEVKVGDEVYPKLEARVVTLDATYVNKLLGLNLTQNEMELCLEKMGHSVKVLDRSQMAVSVPCYRTDILHPMDLVEDVAVGYGYENLRPEIPNVATIGEENIWMIRAKKIVDIFVGMGFQETNTNHLMSEADLEKANIENKGVVKTVNAVNIDYNILRPSLLPIHLKILQENKHHDYPQKIFEVGKIVVEDASEETTAKETYHLSALSSHPKVDYSEIRSVIEALMHGLGIPYELREASHPTFTEGRTAEIFVNGNSVGFAGEVNPHVLNNFEIEMPTVGLELDIEKIF